MLASSAAPGATPQALHKSSLGWTCAGIFGSALLLALYAAVPQAWPLGFVVLLPWLLALDRCQGMLQVLLKAWLMSMALMLAVFAWFAWAIGDFTGIGTLPAMLVLVLLAPVLQPQVLAAALIRHGLSRRGPLISALGGAAGWVAIEWWWPKLLGDTLGHGLQASPILRQVADLAGAAGLTLLLILTSEALVQVTRRRRQGWRSFSRPLLLAIAVPALMAAYGNWRLSTPLSTSEPASTLRIGMVQSNITHYDRLRAELGSYAVVRRVLDTHFGMSRAAIEQQGAEVLLWSETVYPTTFGQAQSADGAALDREILDFVNAAGVPLVFGSYERDADGEYNVAAFVEPGVGLIGRYRKSRLFALTEHVPDWLDTPLLRRWLPWTGHWQPGSGARIFPIRSRDGRELNVQPLICLDAVDPGLAIDGARLGAQAILSLSNDAWFTTRPQGARLHLAVAAFRSIETRLPQLRVTSNGLSAIIDPTGEIVVTTGMGDQAILVGELPISQPPPTLMVRWGDWLGRAALVFLILLAADAVRRRWLRASVRVTAVADTPWTATVVLLTPFWRWLTAALRLLAAAGLLWLGLQMLLRDGLQVNSLAQLRWFAATVVVPAVLAWWLQRLFSTRASLEPGLLVLTRNTLRIELALDRLASIRVWRCPLPGAGLNLDFSSGRRWSYGLALADPLALQRALQHAGASLQPASRGSQAMAALAALRAATTHPWLDHGFVRFVLFPLLPALPAFRLHQHIAFGGSFGEYYTYGLGAWLTGLLIWWAAWAIGLMLFAALLRVLIEAGTVLMHYWQPTTALSVRRGLEILGRLAYYVGIPLWLIVRLVSN